MKKPELRRGRVLTEGDLGPYCKKCGSSQKWKTKFAGLLRTDSLGCLLPGCENYWKRPKEKIMPAPSTIALNALDLARLVEVYHIGVQFRRGCTFSDDDKLKVLRDLKLVVLEDGRYLITEEGKAVAEHFTDLLGDTTYFQEE